MASWRESVLAAEAKKAGNASEITRLTPRPPSLTGKLACSHRLSDKSEFVMRWMAALSMQSKAWRHEWSTEGEQRRRWRTLGALKDDLNKINASWELSRPRSRSSLTKRSTWLFCRSTRSTSSISRRFYDSTRLGRFPIDLVDLRPFWSQLSVRACSLAADAKNSVSKHLMPSHSQFQVEGLAFLFSFHSLIFS